MLASGALFRTLPLRSLGQSGPARGTAGWPPGTAAVATRARAAEANTFDARRHVTPAASVAAHAYLRINRHLWSVSYRGPELGNDLVDDDITFRIRLVA